MTQQQQATLPAPTPAWHPGWRAAPAGAPTRAGARDAMAGLPVTWINLFKALASQLILWHHMALYGPMCEVVHELAPALLDALNEHAKLVVQVFLVTGGFLAAGSLWPAPGVQARIGWRDVPGSVWRRYQRLAKPYLLAVLAVIVAAWLARGLIEHPTIPAAPEPGQLAAHIVLAQDVLGIESLSAGFWYVAIDFQLYVLLVLLAVSLRGLPGSQRQRAAASVAIVVALVLMSLLWWNLDSSLDVYAPYFVGAYGLGVLARWVRGLRATREPAALGLLLVVGVALVVEWRSRIALAGATAMLLCLVPEPAAVRTGLARTAQLVLAFFAQISYSVFLFHYAVILVTGAVVYNQWPESPGANALGMVFAWLASLVVGTLVHRAVERRG
ncbi:MAG TPA: acyltransferase family protein [Ideonella sp.]|uniref:acyltransferase family protein n=1 Tax=Ideonella sp. TaxID=1929293 RepID=UPI002E36B23B|nr:acyltransferase family protein [Ideonella sp.]HEX5686374.1 acyltransferase family protein [Ideonella sp.]